MGEAPGRVAPQGDGRQRQQLADGSDRFVQPTATGQFLEPLGRDAVLDPQAGGFGSPQRVQMPTASQLGAQVARDRAP